MGLTIIDPLTGLHDRRHMETHMGTLVEEAITRGKPLSILDVDYFKSIDERFGHDAGDDVLRECATRAQVDPQHRSRLPLWR